MLVLDEPTNDLDIDTLELLESLLQEFSGTLFLVSHDRAFLENTVTQVIAFEGQGKLTEFGGGYDDWQRFTTQALKDKKNALAQNASPQKNKNNEKSVASASTNPSPSKTKLSFKDQQALEKIPQEIEALEKEQADIQLKLADGELYKTQVELVKKLQARSDEINTLIETLIARWEQLEQASQ